MHISKEIYIEDSCVPPLPHADAFDFSLLAFQIAQALVYILLIVPHLLYFTCGTCFIILLLALATVALQERARSSILQQQQ